MPPGGGQSSSSHDRPVGWSAHRTFLSHAASDKERFVDELHQRLCLEVQDVWYDRNRLRGGDLVDRKILDQALPSCGVFVVVLSKDSVERPYVNDEIDIALRLRREGHCSIIVVVLDGADVPRRLGSALYIAISDTAQFDVEFDELVRSIRAAAADHATGLPDMSSYIGLDLPLPPRHFVNRENDLARLDGMLSDLEERRNPRAAVLSGLPGTGKSALAAQWASAARMHFDDPALSVDFVPHGRTVVPDIQDVVASLVRRIGGVDAVPSDPAETVAVYRRLTSGKRMLLLADNVTLASQLEQIMPQGEGSLVVATATGPIEAHYGLNVEVLAVDVLALADAAVMLREFAGRPAQAASQEEWEELAHGCGRLPLALAVCGARLRDRPTWSVRFMIDELKRAEAPMSTFIGDVPGAPAKVFDRAYREFDSEFQRFYRRLGVFPGATLSAPTAGALTGVSAEVAEHRLDQLWRLHLLKETAPRRYQIHAIVQEHMRGLLGSDETSGAREERVAGLLEWYLGAVRRADRAISVSRLRIDQEDDSRSRTDLPDLATPAAATVWYLTERRNIVPLLEAAADLGLHRHVWRIAEALWLPLSSLRLYSDWVTCDSLGVVAAGACDNPAAEARLRSHLARAYADQGRHALASEEMSRAEQCLRAKAHPELAASIDEFRGVCALRRGDLRDAKRLLALARKRMSHLHNERGVAIVDMHLAGVFNRQEARRRALKFADRAIQGFELIGDEVNLAKAHLARTRALVGAKDSKGAVPELLITIRRLRDAGLRFDEANAHEMAAEELQAVGDEDASANHVQRAYQIYRDLGHARAENLESSLLVGAAELR